MSSEDPLLLPDNEGHNRRGQRAVEMGGISVSKGSVGDEEDENGRR